MSKRFTIFGAVLGVFILAFAVGAVYFVSRHTVGADEPVINRSVSTMAFSPSTVSPPVGETTNVKVIITTAKLAQAAAFQFSFDPAIIQIESFTPTQVVTGAPVMSIDNANGRVVASMRTSSSGGTVVLGTFNIKALKQGTTQLAFAEDSQNLSLIISGIPQTPVVKDAVVEVK